MARARVTRKDGRWTMHVDCGCRYTSPNPNRVHDEARHHRHPPILGPRWLPADTIITGDVCGNSIWTPEGVSDA